MICIKCGRECPENQNFCDGCMAEMERYPVKPGTPVLLPRRQNTAKRPARRRPNISPEEQLKALRKSNRRLLAILFLAVVIIAALLFPAVEHLTQEVSTVITGQNYSPIDPTESTEAIP